MHEFGFAHSIYETSLNTAEKYNAKRIKQINLQIGDFTLINPDILKQSFEIVSKDSIAENAKLEIDIRPGTLLCNECNHKQEIWVNDPDSKESFEDDEGQAYHSLAEVGIVLFKCKACGSSKTNLIGGRDTKIVNIVIED